MSTPAGIPVTLPTVTSNLRAGGEKGQAGAARAEQQKQLAVLWRKSIQAATLLPAAPVGSDVSPEAVGSRSSGGS